MCSKHSWNSREQLNYFRLFSKLKPDSFPQSNQFWSNKQRHGKMRLLIRVSLFSAQREKRSSIQQWHSTQLSHFLLFTMCALFWIIRLPTISRIESESRSRITQSWMYSAFSEFYFPHCAEQPLWSRPCWWGWDVNDKWLKVEWGGGTVVAAE